MLSRRALIGGSLALAACTPTRGPRAPGGASLDERTIAELSRDLASGAITSRSLVEAHNARIADRDRDLRSVIELNPDALALADALDAERKTQVRGPLHGIPVLVKDNIGTADRMETTAGSVALIGARPARDAFVVQRLRAAGAVILGKTNLSEWANIRSEHSSSGWSARGGQCRNPHALDRSPVGSSSGSAAAVAAGFAAAAIGTETDGSIIVPSAACGIVGVKPTVGRIGRSGIIPISRSQDTAGPMARTVADAAYVLAAIAAVDPADAACAGAPSASDYVGATSRRDLRGVRLGVSRKHFGYLPGVDAVAERALQTLRDLGATLVDPVTWEKGSVDDDEIVLMHELKVDLAGYLAALPRSPVRTLADVVRFNREHADVEMPHFGQDLFERAELTTGLDAAVYREALARSRSWAREKGIDAILAKDHLDAIVAPSGAPAWLIDHVDGDHFLGGSSSPAAIAGYPNVTVPAGDVRGLPIGLSFFGAAWSEATLLGIAAAFEAATLARRAPSFVRSIE
jgi:amidase